MNNKKELSSKELGKVTGGSIGKRGVNTEGQFSGFVNMYGVVVGQEYYFVLKKDLPNSGYELQWFKAEVLKTYEQAAGFGSTRHVHKLKIIDVGTSSFTIGENHVEGDQVAAFTTKNS